MTTPTPRSEWSNEDRRDIHSVMSLYTHHELAVLLVLARRDLAAAQDEAKTLLAKLLHAEALLAGCSAYLKDGETPAERIKREIADCAAITRLYAAALKERDAAQEELERVRDKCNEHYMALAAAQSDLASMKADRDAIYNSMRERALAAEARAEQNAKDAERLDWMEANFREGTVRYLHRAFEKWSVNYHKGTTFRAAIDAAREGK